MHTHLRTDRFEICQIFLPRNLNDAVFLADDEFDDLSSGNPAGSNSPEDRVRSLGAHFRGTCQPCVFNPTNAGCSRGDHCGYCHFDHPTTMLSRRVRKRTRDKIKRRLCEILSPPVDLEHHILFKIKIFRRLWKWESHRGVAKIYVHRVPLRGTIFPQNSRNIVSRSPIPKAQFTRGIC